MKFITRNVMQVGRADEVYIPREVMVRDNISDNTKIIFGIIFNECLSKMNVIDVKTVSQAVNSLKGFSSHITLNTIEQECLCGTETAEVIKKELSSLLATLDIADCFYQCQLYYANVPKTICFLCNSGKSLYKMIDMLNTFVDRMLAEPYMENITEAEYRILEEYNRTHSPNLIDEVIDILKQ